MAVVEKQLKAVVQVVSTEQWSKIVIAYEPIWSVAFQLHVAIC